MNPELTFTLTLEETNLILAALQETPAKLCNPLSEKLKQQAQPQLNPAVADEQTTANK
jgi:hypothetical protein